MLIGLQLYEADAVIARRQHAAVAALERLDGVEAVNLQFRDRPFVPPGIETAAVLSGDSIDVTGAPGKRKPLTRQCFDALAERAAARGHTRFAFINADIVVTPTAVAAIEHLGRDAYVISRSDVDDIGSATPPDDLPMTAGLDMFVVSTKWWQQNRRRFRDYIVGETCWDCVYAALLLCHASSAVLNRETLLLHERHEPTWHEPTVASHYNGMLAALDARSFSIWAQYWQQLNAMRERRAPEAEEAELARRAFIWRPSIYQAARQAARSVLARRRYSRLRAAWTAGS